MRTELHHMTVQNRFQVDGLSYQLQTEAAGEPEASLVELYWPARHHCLSPHYCSSYLCQ
jgi:hypothetical protein